MWQYSLCTIINLRHGITHGVHNNDRVHLPFTPGPALELDFFTVACVVLSIYNAT